jgi:hypothetical protein
MLYITKFDVRYVNKTRVQVTTDNPITAYITRNSFQALKVDFTTFAKVIKDIVSMMNVHHFYV